VTTDTSAAVEAWIADDPDPGDRDELRNLLAASLSDPAAAAELADRFAGRLTFGTAGLRGAVAAGPNRMNRAVVRAASAAVAGWLGPGTSVVVGCDARHRSADFLDETVRVLAGAGVTVHVLPTPCPTPLLAFAVRSLRTDAGVMITASHNPAPDNGYKLYMSDGAQVIPPADAQIEARIAALGALAAVPVAAADSALIVRHGDEVAAAYLTAIVAGRPDGPSLNVVYTPMHGVAGPLALRAIAMAGYPAPHVVPAQAAPDPDFPTVAFPNPEEPGALDLAFSLAADVKADLIIASDPDGDRLAVAVPDGSGSYVRLTGDQVGALLGAAVLEWGTGSERLVAASIVSSSLLSRIAAAAGVSYGETLTGFKWVARAADGVPGARFVFGYEEALGYCVGTAVRDKDGISAALAILRLATSAASAGRSLLSLYDELETRHGVHLTHQVTLRTHDQVSVMRRVRSVPPAVLGGVAVSSVVDLADGAPPSSASPRGLPPADVLIFRLDGARVIVRPSGTEPKIKCYIEIVQPLDGGTLAAARAAASGRLAPLQTDLERLLSA
jgi:phosphomannomutase